MCWLSWNLGALTSWNPQGLSRAVMGLLYLYIYIYIYTHTHTHTHTHSTKFIGSEKLLHTGSVKRKSSHYKKPRSLRVGLDVQLYSSFNHGARYWVVVNATPRPLYPQERDPVPIVGPMNGLYGCQKSRSHRDSITGPSRKYHTDYAVAARLRIQCSLAIRLTLKEHHWYSRCGHFWRWLAHALPFWQADAVWAAAVLQLRYFVGSSWNVMAHGDARVGKWRGKWRMEWVASTLHTTSKHEVSRITTADAHTSAASSRLNWRPPADLNGLVRFAERWNLVSVRVPSHFKRSLQGPSRPVRLRHLHGRGSEGGNWRM